MAIYLNSGANLPRIGLHFHWSLRRYSLSLCRPDVHRLTRLSFPRINVRTTAHERQHTRLIVCRFHKTNTTTSLHHFVRERHRKAQPGILRNRCFCCSASQIKVLPWSSVSQPGCPSGNIQPGFASFDHEWPLASHEPPSNMFQPARSHHGKRYMVSQLKDQR